MKEHKYAHVLRWIADGETVEVKCLGVLGDEAWNPLKETMSPDCWKEVIDETENYEFRIKPKTVKIGDREIEAPILDQRYKGDAFYFNHISWSVVRAETPLDTDFLCAGKLFATKEAALAAHEAITALMTGK